VEGTETRQVGRIRGLRAGKEGRRNLRDGRHRGKRGFSIM
jgi:hypothetical protein